MAMAVAVDGSLTREDEALTRLKELSSLVGNTPLWNGPNCWPATARKW
jgi:hypothetical protein